MSIFDDNRFCWSLYPFKWALCLMSYEDQYVYTLKKDNCNNSTIIKMKITSMNL